MRSRLLGLLVALCVAALAAPGGAAPADDPVAARERVRDQQEAVTADLDVLRAQDAEIAAALEQLEANVAAEEALLAEAQEAAAVAQRRVDRARSAVRSTERAIAEQEAELRRVAVEAYMGAGSTDPALLVLASQTLSDAVHRTGIVDVVSTDIDAVVQRLEQTRQRLADQQRDAERASRAAAARRAEAEDRVGRVTAARDAQAAFAEEVEARIESRLAEAAALADIDAELSAQIQAQQEELAAEAYAAGAGGAGGASSVNLVDPSELRTVRGITVHESIADSLGAMLAAAEADGIALGGGGYRSSARQVQLRAAHCPDIWSSPASSCSPPTARPGTSLHERGLAIDFTYGGRAIPDHASPAFRWLAANAERYGFHNLPSEPWHWSVTGG